MSTCSLIPPARAISKTQDRADTNVWWKWPFSIFFIIYYVPRAIINIVCKLELSFLCSPHPIIVLYICMKFHENTSNDFKDKERTHVCHLMVINICVKFYENMSSGFKVMERTHNLLTDTQTHTHTHTQRKDKNYIPHCIAYFICRDITRVTVHVFCM